MFGRYRILELAASASRTASGNGSAHEIPAMTTHAIFLVITAVAGGSPTLDVTIEDSMDGSNWTTVDSFTQATATGEQVKRVTNPVGRYVRVSWTLGGSSPDFTFYVSSMSRGF